MGSSSHLKRLAIPRSWPLPRKTTVWVTRPRAGAHSIERCMPINIVIRDVIVPGANLIVPKPKKVTNK